VKDIEEQLRTFLDAQPVVAEGAFIARSAALIGAVTLGKHSSAWFNAVLRADINRITIGDFSNLQDNVVVHVADDFDCRVGSYCTVGHSALLHGCVIGDQTLVGMGAAVLDGAVVGSCCLIGANALVTQGMQIPDGSLVVGSPAKVKRPLTPQEIAVLKSHAEKYAKIAARFIEKGLAAPVRGL
jgi:carbonic anhydrase/acetyltransferase-like protein (isoleucine patch superfamily)